MYDDSTIREMIDLHKPFGKIELYIDHFTLDGAFDVPKPPKQTLDKESETMKRVMMGMRGVWGMRKILVSNDEDYTATKSSESFSLDADQVESYEELKTIRKTKKSFKRSIVLVMNGPNNINRAVMSDWIVVKHFNFGDNILFKHQIRAVL